MAESTTKITNLTKRFDATTLAGAFFLIGGIQWFLGLLAAESWYDGYSSRIDYVSDLGTGPTALIYNVSVFLLGAFVVAGTFFLYKSTEKKLLPILLTLCGIGAMGVGIFPANLQPMHSIATLLAILFGAFAAVGSYTHMTKPMSIIAAVLGLMSFILAMVFIPYLGLPFGSTETFLGMAKGSLERWAINPILAWIIAFGSYLMGKASNSEI
ncbi:DUF998 domain-containing protein [Candidatus Thorarchaeota archaeon]|nr:MAG: DUF998 domain-containing protein [Candidatus Thorarchaeota archaeon]